LSNIQLRIDQIDIALRSFVIRIKRGIIFLLEKGPTVLSKRSAGIDFLAGFQSLLPRGTISRFPQ
jgi:hypothetical protein